MKCFISYSTADRAIAGDLHRQLATHGIESFLAHETIEVSAIWKEKILNALSSSNAMIILLSHSCQTSDWTGHEVGYFFAKTNHTGLIIPISLDDVKSYGFCEHIQSKPIPPCARTVPLELWLKPLLDANPDELIPVLNDKIATCICARTAEAYFELMANHYATMPDQMLNVLIDAASRNPNVHNAFKCRSKHLPSVVSINKHRLSADRVAQLQEKFDAYDSSPSGRVILAAGLSDGKA